MKKFILCFVACCTFLMCRMEVNAAVEPYYVEYAEPTVGENSGYLVLEFASGKIATYFWSAYSESDYLNDVESMNTGCSIVINDNSLTLTILTDKNIDPDVTNVSTHYTISHYNSSGNYRVLKSGTVVDSNPTYTYESGGVITGYYYKGNVSLVTNHLDSNSVPIVVFGDDIVGQYVNDLYLLIGQNKNVLDVYLPKLNKIEAWESRNNEQLELLVSITNDILESLNSSGINNETSVEKLTEMLSTLSNISGYLASIDVDTSSILTTVNSLLTVTNTLNSRLETLTLYVENIDDFVVRYMGYLELINEKCSTISVRVADIRDDISAMKGTINNIYEQVENMNDFVVRYLGFLDLINEKTSTINARIEQIRDSVDFIEADCEVMKNQLAELIELLAESSDADKEVTDAFADDSSFQSDALNDLNQQSQPNKPDVDYMSDKVDENLDVDIDSNYGLLLSAFTGNSRILTMLLMVASVSLISYVLFGKR